MLTADLHATGGACNAKRMARGNAVILCARVIERCTRGCTRGGGRCGQLWLELSDDPLSTDSSPHRWPQFLKSTPGGLARLRASGGAPRNRARRHADLKGRGHRKKGKDQHTQHVEGLNLKDRRIYGCVAAFSTAPTVEKTTYPSLPFFRWPRPYRSVPASASLLR